MYFRKNKRQRFIQQQTGVRLGRLLTTVTVMTSMTSMTSVAEDDLFLLSENNYQMVVEEGTAQLVSENDGTILEISASSNEAALVRLKPPVGTFWDVHEAAYISVDIENTGSNRVAFRLDTRSDFPDEVNITLGKGALMHLGWLAGLESRQFNCFLVRDEDLHEGLYDIESFPDMRGKPDKLVMSKWTGLDSSKIKEITVHLPLSALSRTVRIKRIFRFDKAIADAWTADPEGFFPFIDRYGQYNKTNWPGKIERDQDLIDARTEEDSDLASHPWPEQFDVYGGSVNGPNYGTTGHFRTQKINGRWWFIDPDGYLFWSFGCNSVGGATQGPVDSRRHYFEWLPDEDPETETFLSGSSFLVGKLNLWRKYGTDYESVSIERALQRMRSWTLNTLGGWQSVDKGQSIAGKLPYTITVKYSMPALESGIVNPFDPDFRTRVQNGLVEYPDTLEDPFCIGYFLDNELTWGIIPVFDAVMISSSESARNEFISGLQETYSSIESLEAVWGMDIGSFNAVADLDPSEIRGVGYSDVEAFYDHLADTYFRIIREEIKAVAPNKLYLGCRWNNWTGRLINVAKNHLDVFSFNLYRKEISTHSYDADVPFISTEFNFGAVDRGKFFPGLGWSSDQRNRGEQAANYVQSAMDNAHCIGAHWFMWMNTPTWGRENGENAGMGLLDDADTPYPELRAMMREIGGGLYNYLEADKIVSPPVPDPAAVMADPMVIDSGAVWMTAPPVIGSYPPFEYRFDELSGNLGAAGSGWQTGLSFTNNGLLPNTQYAYSLTVRDSKGMSGIVSADMNVRTSTALPFGNLSETLIDEDFKDAVEPENESAPFSTNRWYANEAIDWQRDESSSGNSLQLVNSALRVGWGYDEVVANFAIAESWESDCDYQLAGDWKIVSVLDVHEGLVVGMGEYDVQTGELLRRIKTLAVGETNVPFVGQTGSFLLDLSRDELSSTGVSTSNYVGIFFHHDDDGTLFNEGSTLKSDVYLVDNIRVEKISGYRDRDSDGIPDSIENLLEQDPDDPLDGLSDLDRDGCSNRDEYQAGTNLKDPSHFFRMSVPVAVSNEVLNIRVPGDLVFSDRIYILEYADGVMDPWIAIDSAVPGVEGEGHELNFLHVTDRTFGFVRTRVEWMPK